MSGTGNYWNPLYLREEFAAKHNPRARGKKRDKKPTLRHLWQRYEHARAQLWDAVRHEVEYERRCKERGWRYKHLWNVVEWRWKEVLKIEAEIQKLEAEKNK